jgi:3-oxoacyl-[acyl-carrier protein] reductase
MARLSSLSRSVEGQVVVVTGAASGMGRAEAHLFADEGARVACIDIVESVAEVADEIVAAHGEGSATWWVLDVGDHVAIKRTIADVVATLGPVNVLVNNAGLVVLATVDGDDDAFESAWSRTLAVDLTAHQRLARACLPSVRRIINIASTEGVGASRYNSPYVAAKHGVIGLTRALAVELGAQGITVNAVCPGPIRTGMTAAIPDEAKDKFARRMVPIRRYGEPEEVAHAVLSLALPAMSYVNGAVLVVDGGMTVKND